MVGSNGCRKSREAGYVGKSREAGYVGKSRRLDGRVPITLDKPRYLLFSLSALVEVEDAIGSIEELGEKLSERRGQLRLIKWLCTLLLNEGRMEGEQPLTEDEVGRLIHMGNLGDITAAIVEAFGIAHMGKAQAGGDPVDGGDSVGESPPRRKKHN